jgi:hypothetical protein
VTQQERQVNELVKRLSPAIAAAFREAIKRHAKSIDIKELIAALQAGDVIGAAEVARIQPATMFPMTEAIRTAFIQGGAMTVTRGAFGFDGRHPQAEQWFQSHALALVQGISDESVDVARQAISSKIGTVPPAKIAQEIVGVRSGSGRVGGLVGLTSQMADSIISGGDSLRAGRYSDYLRLKLRDKRFDRIINAARKTGKPLTETQIKAILAAHKQKALAYRGKLIAANESFTALAAGRHESYRQMIEAGVADGVTKKWVHGLSLDARVNHVTLNGTVVDFEQPFDLGGGVFAQHPHDANLPASETLGCRCSTVYRLVLPKG